MKLEDLKRTKIIIHNKEHCKTVLDRLYDIMDGRFNSGFLKTYGDECGIIYIHTYDLIAWGSRGYDNAPTYKTITLDDLYSIEMERKKIAFYEHITAYGYVRYLTENKEELWVRSKGGQLERIPYKDNIYKIPNGRVIYVYADDLTYCGN